MGHSMCQQLTQFICLQLESSTSNAGLEFGRLKGWTDLEASNHIMLFKSELGLLSIPRLIKGYEAIILMVTTKKVSL